jgi:broad specificity polyphosphatase/5'/3'-nucleotidase SurE
VAALAGIPSLAVSGLDDDIPGAVQATVDWIVRLAGTELGRDLEPPGFLTVSLPRIAPDSILGVRVTDRSPLLSPPRLEAENENVWRVVGLDTLSTPVPRDSDQAALDQRYIAVVPMRADEVDLGLLARWRRGQPRFPAWR